MAKQPVETAPALETSSPDALAQLTAADVLNLVSKAAQAAARSATSNETRVAFTAFNKSLIDQLGGGEAKYPQ